MRPGGMGRKGAIVSAELDIEIRVKETCDQVRAGSTTEILMDGTLEQDLWIWLLVFEEPGSGSHERASNSARAVRRE